MGNNPEIEKIEFQVEVDYIAKGTFYTGFTKYISTTGLYIITTEITQPGDIVFVDMYLPNYRHKLKLKGRVLRSSEYSYDDTPPGMEIEFIELKEHLREVIADFINSRAERI